MDRLPRELIDAILQQCAQQGPRNTVLELRLVCRVFDRFLKPFACRTIALDFSRLSKASGRRIPDVDALQTIGKYAKCMYIDMMVLRDEFEVEFLSTLLEPLPSMKEFIHSLQYRYCMSDTSFTEIDYHKRLLDMCFNCDQINRLRINLPCQLVGQRCNTATMILANTFSAFAERFKNMDPTGPEPVRLETLVIENITDQTIYNLWKNPSDVRSMMHVFSGLKHAMFTIRRVELADPRILTAWGRFLWEMFRIAESLDSLRLVGTDDDRPPRGLLKQTKAWLTSILEWRALALPVPPSFHAHPSLTSLALERLDISPMNLQSAAWNFGSTLRTLILNEVYLKVEQSTTHNRDTTKSLWIGLPNQRPEDDNLWMAMQFRILAPKLELVRASSLSYDHFLHEDLFQGGSILPEAASPDFDFVDPSGLGRSLAQRFVEVTLGYAQPPSPPPAVRPVVFLPEDSSHDHLVANLRPRPAGGLAIVDYDANAHHAAVDDPTGRWHRSLDGLYPNSNAGTLQTLHAIADTAFRGMNEIQRHRDEAALRDGVAGEPAQEGGWLAANLLNMNFLDE
ncbi:hypothetical protein D7B24_003189 [Verticillium nonalfalfae]|uniref:Uncharacterized protein n=1 Tax=Verticillium nonalfalfae TaxID=1051616 RepID=A0A3M9YH40_9PEZI|nr:uncharacterized protein D7B24_003189 [Verticillium nonalfalfae]RNJ59096.1 hypothetical protein D7B24_003189 [Verticillium nonalfalfae]